MKKIMNHLMGTEPSLVLGALTALIALAVGFGLPITPEQTSLILAAVAAVMSVILRRIVTSPVTAKKRGELLDSLSDFLSSNDVQSKLVIQPNIPEGEK